jgi:hypothetical protein
MNQYNLTYTIFSLSVATNPTHVIDQMLSDLKATVSLSTAYITEDGDIIINCQADMTAQVEQEINDTMNALYPGFTF